jgi:hypothetical protein
MHRLSHLPQTAVSFALRTEDDMQTQKQLIELSYHILSQFPKTKSNYMASDFYQY